MSWRKGLRRVWGLPYTSHSYLLHMSSQCIPPFDEICRRSINFIRSCLSHDSSLVRHIAQYAVNHARSLSSFLGQNLVYCLRRYNCTLRELLDGSVSNIVRSFVFNSFDDNMRCSTSFLLELIMIRSNRLRIGLSDDSFSPDELQ